MAEETPQAQENQEGDEERGLDTAELELEAPTQADFEALQADLDTAQAKANEYLDGWQRSRAEFANYKKRIEREQEQVYQSAAGTIIKRYLDVLDDLERALKNRPQSGDGAAWAEGIELIYRKLSALLENEGVKAMKAEGETFDPNLHEAIAQEDNADYESGQIIEVIKSGYMLGDRVLRPAQVRIAR
jgi:molecular chaperone GrpE